MAYFVPYIDDSGLHIPTYQDIMDYLEEQVRLIFGNDIYLGDDAQDYQLLSVFAAKLFDVMQLAELNYNNRSPATASGAALDTLVAINGLQRQPATASTATVTLTGTAGAVISRGAVQQVSTGYLWSLPASVTIGSDGTAEALATCQQLGPTIAVPGDLSIIATPTAGWVSVTNAAAADLGRAVETDAELRARQAQSVANPSQTIIESLQGGIASLPGVSLVKVYQNDTNETDSNGLPPHSIEAVVEGGEDYDIAYQINLRKDDGVSTNGTESETVVDTMGQSHTINFSRPTQTPIYVSMTIKPLVGYKGSDSIKAAVAAYINALGIGEDVYAAAIMVAAMQTMTSISAPEFNITTLQLGTSASPSGTADIAIGYRAKATCTADNIVVTEAGS